MLHRSSLVAVLGLSLVASTWSACGGEELSGGDPKKVQGTYAVSIELGGKTDNDTLTISPGSGGTVILSFVFGFSQLRSLLSPTNKLSIVQQAVRVQHATGIVDGSGSGTGQIAPDGTITLKLDVTTAGPSPVDGGVAVDGGATRVSYNVSGMRQ